MQGNWKAFLTQAGALFDRERIESFGDPAWELRQALEGDILCDLSHLGLIRVGGEDAERFLQGQLTCDIRLIKEDSSRLGALCSPKGRMLATFRVFRREGDYYLRTRAEQVEPLLHKLRLYVLRSKVTLEDADPVLGRIGLAGRQSVLLLEEALGMVPLEPDRVLYHQGLTVIRLPGEPARFEIYGQYPALENLWLALAPRSVPAGVEPWTLLEILAGVPAVHPETQEAFIPQMTNLQLLGGVSFRKGCYTGQEVVARTQHLGRLKRRMYRAHLDSGTLPRAGTPLHCPLAGESQDAGRIVEAARHPDGGFEVLAVVPMEYAREGTVYLGQDGPPLQFQPLPYPLEH